jgi:type I restriction enzyme M protein
MARPQTPKAPKTTAQRLDSIVKSARQIMRKDKGLNGELDRLPMLTWIMFLKFLDDMERLHEDEAALAGKDFERAIESPYRWRDWASQNDGITGPDLIKFIAADETIRQQSYAFVHNHRYFVTPDRVLRIAHSQHGLGNGNDGFLFGNH